MYMPSDMDPPPCPQGYGDRGPQGYGNRGPQNRDPHFTQIPAQKWSPGRILAAKKRLPGLLCSGVTTIGQVGQSPHHFSTGQN